MLRARWRTLIRPPLYPPLIVMGAAALLSLAAAQLAVAAPLIGAAVATDCSAPGAAARAMSRQIGLAPVVAERFDSAGTYTGQSLGFAGRTAALTLPSDSFVADRNGDALIYTTSVSGKSEVHLVDLASGCDALIARPAGVVRSAILSPVGDAVYAHAVSYPGRDDDGVTRYSLDVGTAQRVVPPIADDPRFGPTFGTQLGWSTDGTALFVQSCAIESCRTRVLDVATTDIATYDADGQGPIIGVTAGHVITFGACGGVPCSVLSIDRTGSLTHTLTAEGWSATLSGGTLDIETATGTLEVAQ